MDKENMIPFDANLQEKEKYVNSLKEDIEDTLDITKIIEEINNEYQ